MGTELTPGDLLTVRIFNNQTKTLLFYKGFLAKLIFITSGAKPKMKRIDDRLIYLREFGHEELISLQYIHLAEREKNI